MQQVSIRQKIILGFSAIGLLLLTASSFFYQSLSHISRANLDIETLAVPVQKQSNVLQLKLLQLIKLVAVANTQKNSAEITRSQQVFNQLKLSFNNASIALNQKVSDQVQMQSALNQADAHFNQFIQASEEMFVAKLENLAASESYKTHYQVFDDARVSASNAMLDLELIVVTEDQQRLLEEVVGTGTRIDDMLFTMGNTMLGLSRSEDVVAHKEDMIFLMSNLNSNFDYLKRQAEPLDSLMSIAVASETLSIIAHYLDQPGELYLLQQKIIEQESVSLIAYGHSQDYFSLSVSELEKLISLADERFVFLQNTAKDEIKTGETLAIVLAIVFVIMASFISYMTTRAMLVPLNSVNNALARIASGDLSRRVKKYNDDEFGTLIDSINTLAEDLTQLLNDIQKNAHRLDESAVSYSEQSQRIAGVASVQITRIDDVKHGAEQMSVSANTVKDEADTSAMNVSEATEHSHEIKGIADANNERVSSLSARLLGAVEIMDRLNGHSQSIGGILDTIVSIAEQTNLLALNAAIESARAGEHGRGFAVVADEVRTLALRTQESTAEIQTTITALQQETSNAVKEIGLGQSQAMECVTQSLELSRAIELMDGALSGIEQMSKNIALVAQEQLSGSERIVLGMAEAADAAGQNEEEAKNMAKRSEEMNELARSLTSSVERFQL
ncbi:methyl-accepting chemotaxis protein [Shewanella eurypsychrophilus]|uniref:Methyl-accepting chemotaxis protein n=1 Tax=Shewanella eurypsychrophilus TaxID=2593656 RepID=A0ABX6V1M1_9GAMM|nr:MULTISPECIES: methyl-accepting chemotaxis protein [Shewanella]QFU20614.1 HAMP domain-containing protein [Shewanella sp. YLB-09]QFU20895.1 HAMP domain-containing protein [Shewanella sp. YLB-09]QPG56184.1 methyl-accepting chemotaxis protein [Shewanella eurypsychrophilus]